MKLSTIVEKEYVRHVEGHFVDLSVVELFDITEHADIVGGDKVDSDTLSPESATTTDTMDVVLAVGGEIVVDDERDLLDINTASEQVGRDEDTGRAGAELLHEHFTSLLLHVSVLIENN